MDLDSLDYAEWLAKSILSREFAGNFYLGEPDQKRLARALLAMLPVIRAAERWRDSLPHGNGELAHAIDTLRRSLTPGTGGE